LLYPSVSFYQMINNNPNRDGYNVSKQYGAKASGCSFGTGLDTYPHTAYNSPSLL